MDLYSASVDDLETVTYFLVFHKMGECLRKTSQPDNERRVRGKLAQYESNHPLKDISQCEQRIMP